MPLKYRDIFELWNVPIYPSQRIRIVLKLSDVGLKLSHGSWTEKDPKGGQTESQPRQTYGTAPCVNLPAFGGGGGPSSLSASALTCLLTWGKNHSEMMAITFPV